MCPWAAACHAVACSVLPSATLPVYFGRADETNNKCQLRRRQRLRCCQHIYALAFPIPFESGLVADYPFKPSIRSFVNIQRAPPPTSTPHQQPSHQACRASLEANLFFFFFFSLLATYILPSLNLVTVGHNPRMTTSCHVCMCMQKPSLLTKPHHYSTALVTSYTEGKRKAKNRKTDKECTCPVESRLGTSRKPRN